MYILCTSDRSTLLAPQLNCATNIVLEVKEAKIKTKVKLVKKQSMLIHLSLINDMR